MKAKVSVGSRVWQPCLLGLSLIACSQVGQAQIAPPFTSLYQFSALQVDPQNPDDLTNVDGADIRAGLIQATDGNLYGTASLGGIHNFGTVFRITTSGVLTPLLNFNLSNDGGVPNGGLIQANDGNFYGTTINGPITASGSAVFPGALFKITTTGALTTLYDFSLAQDNGGIFTNVDGAEPWAGLIQGKDGYLYGTTSSGGANGNGTVFKVKTDGTGFQTLHSFSALSNSTNTDGVVPKAGLIQASDGNLYGTTSSGGAHGWGTVFKITTQGALTTLYAFSGNDGANPVASLIQGKDGNLYGTTLKGGGPDCGTAFKLTTRGVLTTLYAFSGGTDGYLPNAGLIQGKDGNLYGTTQFGGASNNGTVFKITTKGVLTTLYSFSAYSSYGFLLDFGINTDGGTPMASLLQGTDGNLYGTTREGGINASGTVFKLTMTPVISSFSPASGPVGTSVTVTGSNFTEATAVKFGALSAKFTVNSDTSLTFVVPAPGAASAKITVVSPFGKTTSSTTFIMAPVITGFSPASGPVGTSVTLTGVNFTGATSVKLGALSATFTVNSDTSLTFVVPAGAKSAKIAVVNAFGKTNSSTAFTVTH